MANFLDKFPLVRYTVDKKLLNEYDSVRNILFRVGIIRNVMENNVNAYYYYAIRDGDTPEILAEKIYGNPQSHWIILYANNIYDPYVDWPMNDRVFEKYMIKKYGSLNWAKTNYHHYEKVITRDNPLAQVTTTTRFVVNDRILTNGVLTLSSNVGDYQVGEIAYVGPSEAANIYYGTVVAWSNVNNQIILANTAGAVAPLYDLVGATSGANNTVYSIDLPSAPMDAYNTLVDTTDFSTYEVSGRTVFETVSRDRITYWDYEYQLNEDKRLIRIIQPTYYQQIMSELDSITNTKPFPRRP